MHNLDTGERLERRGDETFPTASLIKVPILVTVYDLVEKGQLSLDDPLTVLKIDKVPGSGLLQFMHDDAIVTVHDAAWLMIDDQRQHRDQPAARPDHHPPRVGQDGEARPAAHEGALEELPAELERAPWTAR